jgi:protein-disulfide isomerase
MDSWLRGPRAFALAGAVAAVVGAGLVAASLTTSSEKAAAPPSPAVVDSTETARLLKGIPQRGTTLGRSDAPVTLVEYADLQCPYCAQWSHQALPELIRDYVRPGKLRIEFRGLAFIGPESELGLRAALAAGEQGRLWQVLHLLYRHQGHENSGWLTEGTLRQVGGAVEGLDTERMMARLPAMSTPIDRAKADAAAAGIAGTPSFELGATVGPLSRVEVSSLAADALRPAIDAALAR